MLATDTYKGETIRTIKRTGRLDIYSWRGSSYAADLGATREQIDRYVAAECDGTEWEACSYCNDPVDPHEAHYFADDYDVPLHPTCEFEFKEAVA